MFGVVPTVSSCRYGDSSAELHFHIGRWLQSGWAYQVAAAHANFEAGYTSLPADWPRLTPDVTADPGRGFTGTSVIMAVDMDSTSATFNTILFGFRNNAGSPIVWMPSPLFEGVFEAGTTYGIGVSIYEQGSCVRVKDVTSAVLPSLPDSGPRASWTCRGPYVRLFPALPDAAFNGTSYYGGDPSHQFARSRLFSDGGSWAAGVNDMAQFIQANLGSECVVFCVLVQCQHNYNNQVTAYKLQRSMDALAWEDVLNRSGGAEFPCELLDGSRVAANRSFVPFRTRFVRLLPTAWHGHVSLRWDVMGAPAPIGGL
jgi:hypothetical protein